MMSDDCCESPIIAVHSSSRLFQVTVLKCHSLNRARLMLHMNLGIIQQLGVSDTNQVGSDDVMRY